LDENSAGRDWVIGARKAAGQNLARSLMEAPSNVITPTEFAKVGSLF
jgi:leucyl aminopeptidase